MRSSEVRRPITSLHGAVTVRPIESNTRQIPAYPIIAAQVPVREAVQTPPASGYPIIDNLALEPQVESPLRRKFMKKPLAFRSLDTYLDGLRKRMKMGEKFDKVRLKEFAHELVNYADLIDQIAQQC